MSRKLVAAGNDASRERERERREGKGREGSEEEKTGEERRGEEVEEGRDEMRRDENRELRKPTCSSSLDFFCLTVLFSGNHCRLGRIPERPSAFV